MNARKLGIGAAAANSVSFCPVAAAPTVCSPLSLSGVGPRASHVWLLVLDPPTAPCPGSAPRRAGSAHCPPLICAAAPRPRCRRLHHQAPVAASRLLPRGGTRRCPETGPDQRKTACQRRTRPTFATPTGHSPSRSRHGPGDVAVQPETIAAQPVTTTREPRHRHEPPMARNPTWSNIGSDKSLDARNPSSIRSARHQAFRAIRIAPAAPLTRAITSSPDSELIRPSRPFGGVSRPSGCRSLTASRRPAVPTGGWPWQSTVTEET